MPDPTPLPQPTLSSAEHHLVARLRASQTQPEAAARLGLSLWEYRRREKGIVDGRPVPRVAPPLAVHEVLVVLRQRAGLTRRALARRMKISEFWLYQIERGEAPPDAAVRYWSGRK